MKTRLTVRMIPRRRTKGSQVFTKAPTLTERKEGRPNGKSPMSGVYFTEPCLPTDPDGAAAPKEAPGTTPSPPDLVSQGNRPSLARHRLCGATNYSPGQGLFWVPGRHATPHWAVKRCVHPLWASLPHLQSPLWGGLRSQCRSQGCPLTRPTGRGRISKR